MFHRAFSGVYVPFFPTPCPLALPLLIRVLFPEDMRSRLDNVVVVAGASRLFGGLMLGTSARAD